MRHRSRGVAAFALTLVGALALTACAPGSGSPEPQSSDLGKISKDVAAAGDVTLTVWDQNTDGPINEAQEELNKGFMKKYPNVKIERVSRSFADLKTTLGLALDSPDAPDVVQANQGYPDMGTFVEAGLLRPVDDYADLYGWKDRFPERQLKLNSFSEDGSQWQGDKLYGVSQTGEIVGVYYNRKLLEQVGVEVPKTIDDFSAALKAADAAGVQPLEFGNTEKSPGIHLYGIVQAALLGADGVNDLVSGQSGAWTDDASVKAASLISDWVKAGYIPDGSSGISRDAARASFAAGDSLFYVEGTWRLGELSEAMGSDVGFFAMGDSADSGPVTTGGVGLAWSMTREPVNSDVAAAYIDYITGAESAQLLVDTGNLPAVLPDDYEPASGTLEGDVVDTWRTINETNGLVPYLDYATPTFYDTLTASVQELVSGQLTPDAFAEKLQADYSAFVSEGK